MTAIDCLRELVALKKLKDRAEALPRITDESWPCGLPSHEYMEIIKEYNRREPLAWAAASAIIENAGLLPDGRVPVILGPDSLHDDITENAAASIEPTPVAAAPTGASDHPSGRER